MRSWAQTVTPAGGGGSVPTVGDVAWGPDFGESADANTFTVTALVDLEAVNLDGNVNVTATPDLEAVDLAGSVGTVLATVDGTALGAPFWQNESHNTSSSANVVVTKPSGTIQGDLLVLHWALTGNPNPTLGSFTAPSGWTAITGVLSPGLTKVAAATYWKIAGASEPADYTFTVTGSGVSLQQFAEIHRIKGTHATVPIDNFTTGTVNATSLVTDPVSPSIDPVTTNTLVLRFLAHDHAALTQTHTPPGTHVERTDYEANNAARVGSHSMTRVYAADTATETATHDCTETVATDATMVVISIAPGNVDLTP